MTPEEAKRLRDIAGYLAEQAEHQITQSKFLKELAPEEEEEDEEEEEPKKKKRLDLMVKVMKSRRKKKEGSMKFKGKTIMENSADSYLFEPIHQFE